MIHTFIPYDIDRHFGRAINASFETIGDDDWAFIIDHDCTLTTSTWYKVMLNAIAREPEAGAFCNYYNKGALRALWQVVPGIEPENNDIAYHRRVGTNVERSGRRMLTDVTKRNISGNFLMSKKVWKEIGGVTPNQMIRLDWEVSEKIRKAGRRIYLMESLYIFHWGKKRNHFKMRPGRVPR
jgi:GT2 family glycosyltransferase